MTLCPYWPSPFRTTARMTALSPGQSPPPVRMPILIGAFPSRRCDREAASRPILPRPVPLLGDSSRARTDTRLRARIAPHLQPGEEVIDWTRAWVSDDGRFSGLLAARHRDFVVVTSARLLLWSCGFFTRRPRHHVFNEARNHLAVTDVGSEPQRRLRVEGRRRKPLRFELGDDEHCRAVAGSLLETGSEDA